MSSAIMSEDSIQTPARVKRWHILVFLLPAFAIYSAVMILPLVETLRLSLFNTVDGQSTFVGFANFQVLFGQERWAADFWRALKNNFIFFAIHMLVQNPLGIALAAMLSIHVMVVQTNRSPIWRRCGIPCRLPAASGWRGA